MGATVAGPRRPEAAAAGADHQAAVVLIGFQDQGNLGMGYLAAVLEQHGHAVEMLEFRSGAEALAARVLAADPLVVGFSLIFQYYVPGYREVARALRAAGVRAHFTMGGHFPSLCHDETLRLIPDLDSVARFEGEMTLLELTERLAAGQDWHDVPGLAYVRDGEVVESPARPLIQNLDDLPRPLRPNPPERVLGLAALPVLASRGCARRCSFCSIHMFYRTAKGKVVRVRAPECVVAEMRELHDERGVRVFLFQDDDFPLWGKAGRRWVEALVDQLHAQDLVGRVIWKISCRAEYVEAELFSLLRDAGLYLVYMGIESGTEAGLEILHKQLDVATNRHAIDVLKELDLLFEYGFMLFDPASSFESIRANLDFLRSIIGDGSAGATFCRMLPYGGTPIRARLAEEGRLRGDVTRPDYTFLDPRLDDFHRLLDRAAGHWIHGEGVSHRLNWAWHELTVARRLVDKLEGLAEYRHELAALTARSNAQLLDWVEQASRAFQRGDARLLSAGVTTPWCRQLDADLIQIRDAFVSRNQTELLAAIEAGRPKGPVVSPQIF
jgi:anaerobic magnesium-protoporphyrin IX monomethyl ester cyclase